MVKNPRSGPAFRRESEARPGAGAARGALGDSRYPVERRAGGGRRQRGSRQPETDREAESGGGQAASKRQPAMVGPALGPDRDARAPDLLGLATPAAAPPPAAAPRDRAADRAGQCAHR